MSSSWSLPPFRSAEPRRSEASAPPAEPASSRYHQPVYPSRSPVDAIDVTGFRSKLKRAMSRALKECPHTRAEVAALMAEALGQDDFSLATLNAYTAESNETHQISVVRFKAFVRATGALWLWDFLVADDGCIVLVGEEARLAEIARLQQEMDALDSRLSELRATPVAIDRRGR